MRILVSGSTGMVGTAFVEALAGEGHTVVRLLRPASAHPPQMGAVVRWDPVGDQFDGAAADGADAVVHLAGASIASGRWTAARKAVLRTSRVEATRHLVANLTKLSRPPRVLVCASAVGYFGDRGDEALTEQSVPGGDFLAQLARDWEAAAARAAEAGMRVVSLRFGVILSPRGGALPQMLLPFRLGLGGRLGSGRQWMSWLTLAETVSIVRWALENASAQGPVNAVAPNPVRNAEFTKTLGRVLRRPTIFPAPAFALRLALGEMAGALLLSSQRVLPKRLEAAGYRFLHTELEPALRAVLNA